MHLLLTSRQQGGDRRVVDASVSSACAEFLAHALAVVVWAVPHATRRGLFGDGDCGGGDVRRKSEGVREATAVSAAARRTSVLRCLARLMRRSMDSDNTRVRFREGNGRGACSCRTVTAFCGYRWHNSVVTAEMHDFSGRNLEEEWGTSRFFGSGGAWLSART